MPDSWFNYPLLSHQFHLIDVDFSFKMPPWVLSPGAGFTSIGMPDVTLEMEEVQEGTSLFPYKVVKRGNVNSITLSRGVSPFVSDFWRWTMACLKGTPPEKSTGIAWAAFLAGLLVGQAPLIPGKRRNMLLLHLAPYDAKGLFEEIGRPLAITSNIAKDIQQKALATMLGVAGSSAEYASKGLDFITGGLVDMGITSIPAKGYMLFDCLPIRCKPGSDFDASTSQVSIEELELSFTRFEEFALLA